MLLFGAALGIVAAGVTPPTLLLHSLIQRTQPDPMVWLFAFSFTGAILMVSFLYLMRVKAAYLEFQKEERERELSWELFQRGYVHKEDAFAIAKRWSAVQLPYKRKKLLVCAGILPEDSLKTETMALTDDSLRVMGSLTFAGSSAKF